MAQLLRLLVDENIPVAAEAFGRFGMVRWLPGHAITAAELAKTDVLLVRSVTTVNEELLANSPVRFVGTATAGTDHIDEDYLASAGIRFASAEGSNTSSVVEYTLAALVSVAVGIGAGLRGQTLGVVGSGRIGAEVARRAEALGMTVLRNDPPLDARHPRPSLYVAIEDVLEESDFVTIHTPLTADAKEPYPTYHLFGPAAFAMMKPTAMLINSARGAVVDNEALKDALKSGTIAGGVLDVWEGEPDIDTDLAKLTRIATPHIAGYSLDGKVEGTRMLEVALRNCLAERGEVVPAAWDARAALESGSEKGLTLHALPVHDDLDELNEVRWLNVLIRQAYNLRRDDTLFRQAVLGARQGEHGYAFRELRRSYPVRRSWDRFTVKTIIPDGLRAAVTDGLGMAVTE